MYLKMIKTVVWPLFTHKYILVNKKVAAVHHFVYIHILSELPPLSIVGADIVLEHGNVDNFLNLFENV